MRLVAEHEGNRVVVLDNVESLMETGSWMVKVENVTAVLAAMRTAADVLLPTMPVDPERLEYIAGRIRGVAQIAKALADKHPAEPESEMLLAVIRELNLPAA